MDFLEVLTVSGQKAIINKNLIKTIKQGEILCFIETNDNLYVTDANKYDEIRRQLLADEDDLK